MKILIIHCRYQLRGGEDAVVEQELALLKQQHLVEILYFQNLGGISGAFQFLGSIWNLKAATEVKNKILEFLPDVVHVHNWHFALGPLVFQVISRQGIPIVHTVHNYRLLCPSGILLHNGQLFTDSLKQSFPWSAVRNKAYRSSTAQTFWLGLIIWFHKKLGTWKKIDSYVCLTPFSVNLFQESNFGVPREQFAVKPNFTSASEVMPFIEKENHFLFVGRLSEEKGIETLLKAFSELPFSLKIAGDGPLKSIVLAAVREFANISYLGNLTTNEVNDELLKTQALLFPSIWYEGMPMTLLEAFSSSTPIIASNLGAMTSMITSGYNGFHFESGNVANIKEVVSRFDALSSLEKKQMSTAAFHTYQSHYSAELQLGYFEAIYNTIIIKK